MGICKKGLRQNGFVLPQTFFLPYPASFALVILAPFCTNLFYHVHNTLLILDPKFIRSAPEGFLYFQQRINGNSALTV